MGYHMNSVARNFWSKPIHGAIMYGMPDLRASRRFLMKLYEQRMVWYAMKRIGRITTAVYEGEGRLFILKEGDIAATR